MAKYVILEASDKDELSRIVNKNLEAGWICRGGAVIGDGGFYQTIAHDSDGAEPYKGGVDVDKVCGICGESNCTNKIHAKLEDMAGQLGEIRTIGG